ncbi:MAG TPA: hypothetical protein VMV77_04635 [Bacteroidales bacterium]|nr:hypothetical protein [Bacteroidales bacterium]
MKTEEDNFTSTTDGVKSDECPRCGIIWDKKEHETQECLTCGYPEVDTDDECNCSDPGCPCRGHKIGGL